MVDPPSENDRLVHGDQLRPTPEQHQRLKSAIHGERFVTIKRSRRRYLVIGRGGGEAGDRRERVRSRLDERDDATAFRLEDFNLTNEELELWVPAFEILSAIASHIVGIVEDFDGGHVWELGYLYNHQTRVADILWLLKRIYDSENMMRERYDNGMAASHMAMLEKAAADRVIPWGNDDELDAAVARIP